MERKDKPSGSIDGKLERAKDVALGAHTGHPTTADHVGEAAGGISGVLLGAGAGSAAGPLGTLLGGIAGALGGWWTGRAVVEAAERLTNDDEEYYRKHFANERGATADDTYDRARRAYYMGHIASHNPNFLRRRFDDVESELERGWMPFTNEYGAWTAVRAYAREGYERGGRTRSPAETKPRDRKVWDPDART